MKVKGLHLWRINLANGGGYSEDIEVWSVASALRTTGKIPNLNWLIPMAFFDSDYSPVPILIYDYV